MKVKLSIENQLLIITTKFALKAKHIGKNLVALVMFHSLDMEMESYDNSDKRGYHPSNIEKVVQY